MLRSLFCVALAFAIFAGFSLAADEAKKKKKKAGAGTSGEIVKVDATAGTISLKVTVKKKSTEEKEFKLTDKTTVTEVKGEEKTELKAGKVEDLLKKEQFKTGTTVTIEAEEDGKTAKSITIGSATTKKKKKKEKA